MEWDLTAKFLSPGCPGPQCLQELNRSRTHPRFSQSLIVQTTESFIGIHIEVLSNMGAVGVFSVLPAAKASKSPPFLPTKSLLSTGLNQNHNLPNSYTQFCAKPSQLANKFKLSLSHSSSSRPFTLRVNAVASNVQAELASSGAVGENNLLIVGPGVLGRLVAQKWKEAYRGCQLYGQTASTAHHDELIQMGISPSLKGTKPAHQFPYVIFCAPPSRNPDYPGDVREAVSNWNGMGSFLFTSSSAPYDCNDNGYCDEDTPSVPTGRNPRADVLVEAEKIVLDNGGCVLRLAGLYKAERGPHIFWLNKGTVDSRPDHMVNLIHYDDAASLTVAILAKNLHGRTFLGCDNHPLTRQEIMDLVNRSGKFSKTFNGFTGTTGPLGKRLNNSKTRAEIGWEPKYSSYAQFLETL